MNLLGPIPRKQWRRFAEAVIFCFLSCWLGCSPNRADELAARADLMNLALVLEEYRSITGSYPPDFATACSYLEYVYPPQIFIDPWGMEYLLEPVQEDPAHPNDSMVASIVLASCGEDRICDWTPEAPNPASDDLVIYSGLWKQGLEGEDLQDLVISLKQDHSTITLSVGNLGPATARGLQLKISMRGAGKLLPEGSAEIFSGSDALRHARISELPVDEYLNFQFGLEETESASQVLGSIHVSTPGLSGEINLRNNVAITTQPFSEDSTENRLLE